MSKGNRRPKHKPRATALVFDPGPGELPASGNDDVELEGSSDGVTWLAVTVASISDD